jgi:predicted ArsR family transcriptional regulator
MEGLTVTEMADILGIPRSYVKRRIHDKGIKAINREVLYDKSVLDAIKETRLEAHLRKTSEPSIPVMSNMKGLTIKEISDKLGIIPSTVKKRLQTHGLVPIRYAGPIAIYDRSVVKVIKDTPGKGRPPRVKPGPLKPVNKEGKGKK